MKDEMGNACKDWAAGIFNTGNCASYELPETVFDPQILGGFLVQVLLKQNIAKKNPKHHSLLDKGLT